MGNFEWQMIALGKVMLAMVLTAVIGFERGRLGRPAGVRTHMLIGGASTLFALLGVASVRYFVSAAGTGGEGLVQGDPTRIIQSIALGISFIGAGMIIQNHDKSKVMHLTSAASILFTAGIGIAVATDQVLLASGCVAMVWAVNSGLRRIEKSSSREDCDT